MNKLISPVAALALLLTGANAFASSLSCSGSYLFYQVHVSAKIKDSVVVSPGKVSVSGPGQGAKSISISIESGNYVDHSSLSLSGVSKDGLNHGSIDSTYDTATSVYTGTVSVQSVKGNFSTEVMCVVR